MSTEPRSTEPNNAEDNLQAFYDQLDEQDEQLGVEGRNEQVRRRNAHHLRRAESRIRGKLQIAALIFGILGIFFAIAFFTFNQNVIMGVLAGVSFVTAFLSFAVADPDAFGDDDIL